MPGMQVEIDDMQRCARLWAVRAGWGRRSDRWLAASWCMTSPRGCSS